MIKKLVTKNKKSTASSFKRLYNIVRILRSPGGCPWDIEQTPLTLRSSLIEETFECIESIGEGHAAHIEEELGDVFLNLLMISYIMQEDKKFSVSDVLNGICNKLIRRHPHVFGDVKVKDSDEVLANWYKIKENVEGRGKKDSVLDKVSMAAPTLERSCKLQKKAAQAGFDFANLDEVFAKIAEETCEVKNEIMSPNTKALESELGDMLFSVINLCRVLKVEPGIALAGANSKFVSRFKYVEQCCKKEAIEMCAANIDAMNKFWEDAKMREEKNNDK